MEEEARIAEFENANNTVGNDPEPKIEEDIDPEDPVRIYDVNSVMTLCDLATVHCPSAT